MKSGLYIILLCSSLQFVLLGCNNPEKKNKQSAANDTMVTALEVDCSTIGNFLVSRTLADKWIKGFQTIFNRKGLPNEVPGLIDSFWVDACVINNFQHFLQTHEEEKYDGIRIFSIVKTTSADTSSDILIVPTTQDGAGHNDMWTTTVPTCNSTFTNYNLDHRTQVSPWRQKFGQSYRQERVPNDVNSAIKDSLSKSIWFSRCVLDALVNYLNNAEYRLDGLRVYCGAYDKIYPNSHQFKTLQSTYILAVTRSDGTNGHDTDWDLLNKLHVNDNKFRGGGYNHGELCPTVCN